jgi:predicted nucleotidyltransferase
MVPAAWLEAIADWTEQTPQVKQVWLYGSWVKGPAREDSDLDIALVMADGEISERLDAWICGANGWRNQLSQLLPVEIHLEVADGDLSPCVVAPAVREHGVRVYPVA